LSSAGIRPTRRPAVTCGSNPGFSRTGPEVAEPVQIQAAPDNQWKLTTLATAGKTYRLQSSSNLTDWAAAGAPVTPDADGPIEWLLANEGVLTFFRVAVDAL